MSDGAVKNNRGTAQDDVTDESQTAQPGAAGTSTGTATSTGAGTSTTEERVDRSERGLSDLVRRAVSAGVGAASRGKDDIMRAAATEVRGWLDRLDLDTEIARALAKVTIEIKAEIRFKMNEDGKLVAETTIKK